VVGNGEILSAIAAQYDTTVAELVRLNKLADPDKLTVGDKLLLPR
jgi:LysM repeat protein